eukprot:1800198-Rhodomonas_salina.1
MGCLCPDFINHCGWSAKLWWNICPLGSTCASPTYVALQRVSLGASVKWHSTMLLACVQPVPGPTGLMSREQ